MRLEYTGYCYQIPQITKWQSTRSELIEMRLLGLQFKFSDCFWWASLVCAFLFGSVPLMPTQNSWST